MAPTVSLCVMTAGPADRVRALLACCRASVDEIVLVADAAGDPDVLEACADLADRRLLVDCSSITVALGWMLLQCRSDWILRLDDDEVPSAALLRVLPSLVARRFPTNIALPRRWLHPSPASYVASPPWVPDHQVRLIRNVPGIWSFPGELHGALAILGDRCFAAEPIYHADALLSPLGQRLAKAERFERARPGVVAEGLPVNELYVPDEHDVETAPVPDEDRALIERVLDPAPVAPGPPRSGDVRIAGAAEVGRLVDTREVPATAYRAEIALEGRLGPLPAGATRHVRALVTNLGDEWWPAGDAPPRIRLGLRWRHPATGAQVAPEDRVLFTERVPPGAGSRVDVRVRAPEAPGEYVLELDLVHESVRWFGCEVRVAVTVVPA